PDPPERLGEERAAATRFQERWYRVQVPPGARALQLPRTPAFRAIYLNGRPVATAADGRVEFGSLDWSQPNVIALVTPAADELEDSLQFDGGKSTYQLGSWTWTGLSSFSGQATYEKPFS